MEWTLVSKIVGEPAHPHITKRRRPCLYPNNLLAFEPPSSTKPRLLLPSMELSSLPSLAVSRHWYRHLLTLTFRLTRLGILLGYRDSGADIAYNLRAAGVQVVLPVATPDPTRDAEWSFSDTEQGILDAVAAGANVLWANSTLHSKHPLIKLASELPKTTRYVGQNPLDTEKYEDKAWVNRWLNSGDLQGKFPKSWLVREGDVDVLKGEVELPAVLKPVRGRGSYGVTLARTRGELVDKAGKLWEEGSAIIVEVSRSDKTSGDGRLM